MVWQGRWCVIALFFLWEDFVNQCFLTDVSKVSEPILKYYKGQQIIMLFYFVGQYQPKDEKHLCKHCNGCTGYPKPN